MMANRLPEWQDKAKRYGQAVRALDRLVETYGLLDVCHNVLAVFLCNWNVPGVIPEEDEMVCQCTADAVILCQTCHTTWICDPCYVLGQGRCADCVTDALCQPEVTHGRLTPGR
jgi:hypothetical protein